MPSYTGMDWVFDFVSPTHKVIFEINGATHRGRNGGHSSYQGIKKGYFKQIAMQLAGWTLFELDNAMCTDLALLASIDRAFNAKEPLTCPNTFLSYGLNARKNSRLKAAIIAIRKAIAIDHPQLVSGAIFHSHAGLMEYLGEYHVGKTKLCITQVREALLDIFCFERKTIKGKRYYVITPKTKEHYEST